MKTLTKIVVVICIALAICGAIVSIANADESTACRLLHSSGDDILECMDGTETVLTTPPRYTKNGCYPGSVEPVTHEDFVFLRALKCVAGDVEVSGILDDGTGLVKTLDFGELQWIRGTLFITSMPRLNYLVWRQLKTYRVVIQNNPMLTTSRATEFVESVCEDGRRTVQLNAP